MTWSVGHREMRMSAEVLMSCFFATGASVVEGDERFVADVIEMLDILA